MLNVEWLLYAGLFSVVSCWDIAVTTQQNIEYYTKGGALVGSSDFAHRELSSLAYDAATDLLLVIDELDTQDSIFRVLPPYTTGTGRVQPVVRKQDVRGVAFEPVTSTLFWLTQDALLRMRLGDASNGYGDTVAVRNSTGRMESFIGLAIDSCGGYIFWAEAALKNSKIFRAKLDGSDVIEIVNSDLYYPGGLVVDHGARRLYWSDDSEGIFSKIESSDFDGGNRKVVVSLKDQQPSKITVGEDYLYWTDTQLRAIWKFPKNSPESKTVVQPERFINISGIAIPTGIAFKYNLSDQIGKNINCDRLGNMHQKDVANMITTTKEKGNEVPINITTTKEGAIAHVDLPSSTVTPVIKSPPRDSTVTPVIKSPPGDSVELWEEEDGASVKDYVIMALAGLCGMLFIAVAVLAIKVFQLKKRPRIKKRIIVNKNVTPLTARPDQQQCEITIENCCNMNICETPCFEPRSTVRPKLIGVKSKKEEKQNLIDNIEEY